MEVSKGAWCQWYVSIEYLHHALNELEKGGVHTEYIHICTPPKNTEHLLIVYRNPPYKE